MKPRVTDFPVDQVSDSARDEIKLILERDRIYNETREDLYCNNRYDGFFSHFTEESVREFIDDYALRKANYVIYGLQHVLDRESTQLYFRQRAESCFWEIQQKKLFDLQCLWRAGNLYLEGIEVTRDFYFEELNICQSSLVPPVTRAELNIYIDYLNSPNYDPCGHNQRWQHYDHICERIQGGIGPAWYVFYDEAIGSGQLLALPDMKGEKERQYLLGGMPEEPGSRHSDDTAGSELKSSYKTLEFFVTTFEDKSLFRYFNAVEQNHPDISDTGRLNEALRILNGSDEPVPMQPGSDWREAVISSALAYSKTKTSEALNSVFNEYQLRRNAGLAFGPAPDPLLLDLLKNKIALYKKNILRGRRRLNEPGDFRY